MFVSLLWLPAMVGGWSAMAADEAVTLKLQFRSGDVEQLRITKSQTAFLESRPPRNKKEQLENLPASLETVEQCTLSVSSVEGNTAIAQVQCDRVEGKRTDAPDDPPRTFDSGKDDLSKDPFLSSMVLPLGKTTTFLWTMTGTGKVEASPSLYDWWMGGQAALAGESGDMPLKALLKQLTFQLPTEPVKVGSSWAETEEYDFGNWGRYKAEYRVKVREIRNGRVLADIEEKYAELLSMPDSASGKPSVSISGSLEFDTAQGMLRKRTVRWSAWRDEGYAGRSYRTVETTFEIGKDASK